MYLCPLCDSPIGEHDETCSNCNANLKSLREVGVNPRFVEGGASTQAATKICLSCGETISANAAHCPHCGQNPNTQVSAAPQSYYQQQAPAAAPQQNTGVNTMARLGLIFSFFVTILGLIFSIIGLKKAKEMGGNGRGQAIAGLIISCISLGIAFLYIVIYIAMFA
ncbi:MAG: zinc ribbon domain-containing protein, partial [Clostridia bacterium]|nr:zinc ribbon domain-containing protein [Clostridia bacterium]